MSIESPLVLLALLGLVPLVLVFLFEYRHTRLALRYLGQNWNEPDLRQLVFLKWFLGMLFFCLFYLSSILALSGWKWGEQALPRDRSNLEIMVVADISRSMHVKDNRPDRIGRGESLVRELISGLPDARFGLVAFAGTARKIVPLTEDRLSLDNGLRQLPLMDPALPGSAPGEGLDLALSGFQASSSRNQALLLVSDGEFTSQRWTSAIRQARSRGIPLAVLGTGTSAGGQIPLENGASALDSAGEVVVSRLNENLLKDLAVEGGGWYVPADGPDPAGELVSRMNAYLRQSEQEGFRLVLVNRSFVFIAIALFSLISFVLTRSLRWRMLW